MAKKANIYVKRLDNSEVVHTIETTSPQSSRSLERLLSGVLRNMDTDRFFVDESEVETT